MPVMETAQIRLELLDRIALTEDSNLLRQLLQFMDGREESEYEMTHEEKRAYQAEIQLGIDDANAGNVVDFEVVKDRWMKRIANG
ncbi:MAG: hypothetical protein U0176_25050 [Bacteroidia bacterium]